MLSDHDIAHQAKVGPIADVAADLGVDKQHLIPFGDEVTKVNLDALDEPRKRPGKGKLVLVSATTPTAAALCTMLVQLASEIGIPCSCRCDARRRSSSPGTITSDAPAGLFLR